VKRLKKLGIGPGATVASVLPAGPDATTAAMIMDRAHADFAPFPLRASLGQYETLLLKYEIKLLILHSGEHLARDAARKLGIPVANVLRHFEAGIFTLESDIPSLAARPSRLTWKTKGQGIPLVLIAPGPAYRRLADRLDATNQVIGITPPGLEHLPLPHTVEHIAAECVRILRCRRPCGPYALAGWRADGVVALEMARLLEEAGEKIAFVAMLDASALFSSPTVSGAIRHALSFAAKRSRTRHPDFMAEALSQYHPRPWFGKILHLRAKGSHRAHQIEASFEWASIAPQGVSQYDAPNEMLSDSNVCTVATILAAELFQTKRA
jgi:hypothetical protein